MKKLLLFCLIFSLVFLSNCKNEKITLTNDFDNLLNKYPHNPSLKGEYYNEYKKTNNIIYALNKVNYPNFLIPNSYKTDAIIKNNILLVNKNYLLNKNFIPRNLKEITDVKVIKRNGQKMMLTANALNAYKILYQDAVKNDLDLVIYSAYRNYQYQEGLYNKDQNNEFVAKPGASEHQSGEVIDIGTNFSGLAAYFDNTKEAKWLKENAYKYGFILRYPKDKEKITGYPFESWHYRYVGTVVAKTIYEENLSLEEYFYKYLLL